MEIAAYKKNPNSFLSEGLIDSSWAILQSTVGGLVVGSAFFVMVLPSQRFVAVLVAAEIRPRAYLLGGDSIRLRID
jgi:hypothetical protein